MAFPQSVVKQAWDKVNGHCNRCGKQLVWNNRGDDGQRGAWEAHHKLSQSHGGSDTLSNCEILCLNCHTNTKSYGKH